MWKLSLGSTQRHSSASCRLSRETWHQTGTYNAEQYQEPPRLRGTPLDDVQSAQPIVAVI